MIKITNRWVPQDCQTALDDEDFHEIGSKIMDDIHKIVKTEENSSKTIHQLMLNIIKEKANDLNMTAIARKTVRRKKKAGDSCIGFLKRRAASKD